MMMMMMMMLMTMMVMIKIHKKNYKTTLSENQDFEEGSSFLGN